MKYVIEYDFVYYFKDIFENIFKIIKEKYSIT